MQNEEAYSESHRQISVGYSERISDLEVQIRDGTNPPTLLSLTAGQDSCCIFRVPPSLVEINRKAYQPHIVSIGPFYHGGRQFLMIQQHKLRFLGDLLARNRRVSISNLFMTISAMEESIRRSYSETLKFNSLELIEMMVLDGCFIIELFFRAAKKAPFDPSDPLFNVQWVLPCLLRDLLRIENQIPYSVLQALFRLCDANANGTSLAGLALMSFNYMFQRPTRVLEKYYDREGKHLLDLFRQTFLLASQFSSEVPSVSPSPSKKSTQLIPSVEKLRLAGVKFELRKAESFLDIEFMNGVLKIPRLMVDDFTSSLFLNFVAFEQCYSKCVEKPITEKPKPITENPITDYAIFMCSLINAPSDVGCLCDHKIVENYFGSDDEVARFFTSVGKDVTFDIQRSYLSKVFEEVNEFYWNDWHVTWAGFRHTYFDTPWSFISAMAALLLLILTSVQAFFAAYAYIKPPNSKN